MPVLDIVNDSYGFPELGRIRLGVMKKSKKGTDYPAETPHFVLKDAPTLIPYYGIEPTELLVYLPYPEVEANFDVNHEQFARGGLYCRGDGQVIDWAVDPGNTGQVVIRDREVVIPYQEILQTGEIDEKPIGVSVPCPGMDHNLYPRCAECKPRGLLFLLIRDPQNPTQLCDSRLGYYRISTGSLRNIREITENLNMLKQLASHMQRDLSGIPMILRRIPGNTSITTEEGSRAQVTKYFLQIEVDRNWAATASAALGQYALGAGQPALVEVVDSPSELLSSPQPAYEVADDVGDAILDLLAMQDDPPETLNQALALIESILGSAFDTKTFFMNMRERAGISRADKISYPSVWGFMIDEALALLEGAEHE